MPTPEELKAAMMAKMNGTAEIKEMDEEEEIEEEVVSESSEVIADEVVQEVGPSDNDINKAACLKRIQDALIEHDYKESEIPLGHAYWGWKNEYRSYE